MKSAAWLGGASCLFLFLSFASSKSARNPDQDRQAIIAIEQEWLNAQDGATLDRILASDFVHVIPVDHFLTKREHMDWVIHHPERKDRHKKFDKLKVRLYGDADIVNGSVFRDGRWQAVNAQENALKPQP